MVLAISLIVVFSLLLAGNRGLIWQWVQRRRRRRTLRLETVLSNMLKLAEQHEELTHPHNSAVLRAMDDGRGGVNSSLKALVERGWVDEVDKDTWALTPAGVAEARAFAHKH